MKRKQSEDGWRKEDGFVDWGTENGSSPHRCSLHHLPVSLCPSVCLTESSQLGQPAANRQAGTVGGGGGKRRGGCLSSLLLLLPECFAAVAAGSLGHTHTHSCINVSVLWSILCVHTYKYMYTHSHTPHIYSEMTDYQLGYFLPSASFYFIRWLMK